VTSSSENPPVVEEDAHFKTPTILGKDKNMVMGPDGTRKQKLLLLARASSNLTDQPISFIIFFCLLDGRLEVNFYPEVPATGHFGTGFVLPSTKR
jgi:hypothetical protein